MSFRTFFLQIIFWGVSLVLVGCAHLNHGDKHAQSSQLNHGFSSKQISAEEWWNIPYPESFNTNTLAKPQSRIRVEGNHFVTAEGSLFVFRGVNIADPSKLSHQGHWNKALFEEVSRWGANTIRVPVHPLAWRKHGQQWYIARLDEAVRWANESDIYLIIDWHSIGNLESELFQHPMYETTFAETRQFWRSMALRYKNVPTVAVFELFNEPTHNYIGTGAESLGKANWSSWRNKLEELIDLIYVYDKSIIPLVAGYNWAYDLTPVASEPVRRGGIAYAAHPYPQKGQPSNPTKEDLFKMWEQKWGFVANSAPVIATELGWVNEKGFGAHAPVVHNENTYGPNIVEYMTEKGISYTVWIFDPDWPPRMIEDWNFTPSEQGAFFKQIMIRDNK